MNEKKKKVLIVEDEKPVARALELKLNGLGVISEVVYNGEEALGALQKGKFDLVLLDLIMPRLDGFGVLEAMKKKGDKTPVIVSTNLGQEEDEKRAREMGVKDYFVKADTPIKAVIEHVKRALNL